MKTSDGASKLLNRLKARENVKSCVLMADCLSLIKPGQKTVFVDVSIYGGLIPHLILEKKMDVILIENSIDNISHSFGFVGQPLFQSCDWTKI